MDKNDHYNAREPASFDAATAAPTSAAAKPSAADAA